jgi:hypothetical protein
VTGEMHPNGISPYFDDDSWNSTISFAPGIPMYLDGGALYLHFEDGVDPSKLFGRTFRVFDWTGVTPTGSLFVFTGPYDWDLSALYTDGTVTLKGVPEPSGFVMSLCILYLSLRGASKHPTP